MIPDDPNLEMVEKVADALGDLRERVVLVGGCATGFLVTDPAQARIRATLDVDVVVEVASLHEYQSIEKQLSARGFRHDLREDAPICRWRLDKAVLDLMATEERILGFGNPWYTLAVSTAREAVLPSGTKVRVITAPAFLATKLAAFDGRGAEDYRASRDLEDAITIIDGREATLSEIAAEVASARHFLADRIRKLLSEPRFMEALPGHLAPDGASQARLPILTQRLKAIASLSG